MSDLVHQAWAPQARCRRGKLEMEQLPKIVRQRLQATAKPGVHPDPDLLTAFAEKSLNERERAQVLQHLAQCTDCRSVISLVMPEVELAPFTSPARSPWLTWPVLRWGALAACVVVVSAAVTLHYYERPQETTLVVSDKAPVPAAPANLTVESQASNQPNQKLAVKVAPPSPFQSDRDFGAAGKLAKQREGTDTRSAASESAIKGLANGRLENHPLENNPPGTAQGGLDQLTGNRIAKEDAFKSARIPAPLPMAPLRGVPWSSPVAKQKPADTEALTKERNENLDSAVAGSSETVMAEAESNAVAGSQAARGRAKDESDKKVQMAGAAGMQRAPLVGRNVSNLSLVNKTAPSWTLSPDGALQRSLDSGKTWQTIPVASNVIFRALAANDADIWVGGAVGALYHSADAGQHWTQIKPLANGKPLTADIISVEFTDAQHGRLTTDTHETWATSDGGASWYSK